MSLVAQWVRICLGDRGHGFDPWSSRFHMLQGKEARVPQLLSPHSRACKPPLKPMSPRVRE